MPNTKHGSRRRKPKPQRLRPGRPAGVSPFDDIEVSYSIRMINGVEDLPEFFNAAGDVTCPIHGDINLEVEASIALIVDQQHAEATVRALRAIPLPAGHRVVEGPELEPNDGPEDPPGTVWIHYAIEGEGDNTAWFKAAESLPNVIYFAGEEGWG